MKEFVNRSTPMRRMLAMSVIVHWMLAGCASDRPRPLQCFHANEPVENDIGAYRSLMNVRAQVNERYGEAIDWLRKQGREEEARRFELMQRTLPPVRSEKQIIADALFAQQQAGKPKENERGRAH